jgi:peptidoglycan/LPS O-acetylase OafA/YrhL
MLYHLAHFFPLQAGLWSIPFIRRAYLAVDLFFLLSGFVMAHVYGGSLGTDWRAAWRPFALARFSRVYPLFALTLIATIATTAAASMKATAQGISFSTGSLVLQPFLLQQWAASPNWDYPSWSISTEAEAYVVFVFTAGPLLTGSRPRLVAAVCMALVIALDVSGGNLKLPGGIPALVRTLAEFSLGVLLYRAHKRMNGLPWMGVPAFALCVAGLLLRRDFLTVIGLACLILYGVVAAGTVGRIINSAPAVALGNWSYGIYLWHAPVHFAVLGALAASGHPVESFGAAEAGMLALMTAAGVIGLSAITYRHFETTTRRWLIHATGAR